MTRPRTSALTGMLATLLVAGVAATPAMGASSIVSFDPGQPKAEIATTASVRTIAEVANVDVSLKYRPVGGPPCAPSRSTDPGIAVPNLFDRTVPSGDTTKSETVAFPTAGTFQVCGWLYSRTGTDTLIATLSSTFTVASPVGAITSVTAAPSPAVPGQAFVVTVSGQSEVTRGLYTSWRRATEPACGASPSLDPRSTASETTAPFSQGDVLGTFAKQVRLTFSTAGRYRFCSWVASSSSDLTPLGVNETILTVASTKPRVASLKVTGRTVTTRVALGVPGRLRVVLIGKGRTIVLTARQVQAARTITLSYRRPNGVKKGAYTLQISFRPGGGTALIVRRSVTLG